LKTALLYQTHHHRSAVALYFQHIFTGVTVGPLKIQGNDLIQRLTIGIVEWHIVRVPRLQGSTQQARAIGAQIGAADPNHPNGTTTRRCRLGDDGVVPIDQ
jgi:hypothetical protein